MAQFNVKVKDKATGKEMTLTTSGPHIKTFADAQKHIESMPKSNGGQHAGFEVLGDADATEDIPAATKATE